MSLVLAENFLKSSPKCLLACVSSGTRGKIQNGGFFWPKSVKNGHFCQKSHVLMVFDIYLQFLSLDLAENFVKSSPKCLLACVSSCTRGKIQNGGFFRPKSVKKWSFLPKNHVF